MKASVLTDKPKGVLDTSVVLASGIEPLDRELAISTVTLAELHFGVLVARETAVRAERLRRLLALQLRFDPLPLDDAVAASYGQVAAAVVSAGRNPRVRSMDLLIAATAHAHSACLYTRNIDDFRGLEGVVEVIPV
jgi:predicted nucleic acid-binding protein